MERERPSFVRWIPDSLCGLWIPYSTVMLGVVALSPNNMPAAISEAFGAPHSWCFVPSVTYMWPGCADVYDKA
jgi:hypothetical protein